MQLSGTIRISPSGSRTIPLTEHSRQTGSSQWRQALGNSSVSSCSPRRSSRAYPWRRSHASTQLLQSVQIEVSMTQDLVALHHARSAARSSIEMHMRGARSSIRVRCAGVAEDDVLGLGGLGDRATRGGRGAPSSCCTRAPGIASDLRSGCSRSRSPAGSRRRTGRSPPNTSPSRKYCRTRSSGPPCGADLQEPAPDDVQVGRRRALAGTRPSPGW